MIVRLKDPWDNRLTRYVDVPIAHDKLSAESVERAPEPDVPTYVFDHYRLTWVKGR